MSENKYNISITSLLIGVPVLVGASLGYYLYYYGCSSSDSDEKSTSRDKTDSENLDPKLKSPNSSISPIEQVKQLKMIGNKYFSKKNYDLAIENYTKAIELALQHPIEPNDLAIFYQNRAASNEALTNYQQVIEDCTKAIELKKDYIKAYLRRGKAYEKLENYDEAMADLCSVNLLGQFQNHDNMEAMEEIVKKSSKSKAAIAMKNHKFRWPSNLLVKNYFASFPNDPILQKTEGSSIESSDQLKPLFEATKDQNDPISLIIRSSCLSLMGDYKEANRILDQLIELDVNADGYSPRLKAIALIKKSALIVGETALESNVENWKNALDHLEKAKDLDPELPDVYLHLGQLMTMLEQINEGIAYLKKAIELYPKYYPSLAQILYLEWKSQRGNFARMKQEESLEKFKKIIEENGNAVELLQVYAQVLSESNLLEKADEALLEIIKKDPRQTTAKISRALLQIQIKNDPTGAANLIREALKEDPDMLYAYEILGSIEGQFGRYDEAAKIFEEALKYAQSEAEYQRIYGLLDSSKTQKRVVDNLASPDQM